MYQVLIDQEKVEGPVLLRTSLKNDVATFRDELSERFKRQSYIVYLVLYTEGGTVRYLEEDELPLQEAGVVASSQVNCQNDSIS